MGAQALLHRKGGASRHPGDRPRGERCVDSVRRRRPPACCFFDRDLQGNATGRFSDLRSATAPTNKDDHMRNISSAVAVSVLALSLSACATTSQMDAHRTATIHGVVALTDSHGGAWLTQNSVTDGASCAVTQDLIPGFNGGTRAFPGDAQVVVKNQSDTTLGAVALDSPKSGIVRHAPQSNTRYYCEFSWQIIVPAANLYSIEFPGATTQRFEANSVPPVVRLSIGNGAGFTPQGVG
ncbi:hypothetical protein BJ998_000885 [Kutzneria kofuensis]|uniref:Uncharacterized protein n=1 Tax=Kutzneria kofuensis TaxID=103725 RepID=A0A7W9NES4_9PSEU|nr:hypothetical protein [Kutzneria kofuensis]